MRVLLASVWTSNPFLELFVNALSDHSAVDHVAWDIERFWEGPGSADVVHIHWPEALFTDWKEPDADELDRLRAVLQAWQEQASIVVTVHNLHPHNEDTRIYRRLYRLVFAHAHGVVHLGNASQSLFADRHGADPRLADVDLRHATIPHGMYPCFPNTIDSAEARRRLEIPEEAMVFLAFGQIRSFSEIHLLLEGFRRSHVSPRHLLVAGQEKSSLWPTTRWYLRARAALDARITLDLRFVPSEDVQVHLNAADALVIPRTQALNSGNIALGFTFGRVVVGPDSGVIGEVLRHTGNPVYVPGNAGSLAQALDRGRDLQQSGHGAANRHYAQQHMDWTTIAEQYVAFYGRCGAGTGISPSPRRPS